MTAKSLSAVAIIALTLAACGATTKSASSRGAGSPAKAAAMGPFVYVANTKFNEVSEFSALPSDFGALKPIMPSTVPAGPFPYTIAVDPRGSSAYATSSASEVFQYTINPITGRLTPKSPATVATGSGGTAAIAFTPNGTSAYVVGRKIYQYTINPITGQLTPKSPATVTTPPNPEPIAVSPNGNYAYVANCGGCGYALRKRPSDVAAGSAGAKRRSAKPSYLCGVPDQPHHRCAELQADRDRDDWKRRELDRDRAQRQERLRGDQHQRGLAIHDQPDNRQTVPKEA